MSEHTKNSWPNRRRHDTHGGDVSGMPITGHFSSVRTMVLNTYIKKLIRRSKDCLAR